ncbi:MAG: hypothetical protein WAP47_07610 [Candidatus Rokuibacteriota bacterium]
MAPSVLRRAIIALVFWCVFLSLYTLQIPLHAAMRKVGHLRSEYTVPEQLSKYYLFLVILVAVHSYRVANDAVQLKTAICFLLLGLVMYLAESNMLTEAVQPLFAVLIIPYTVALLARSRSWVACGSLLLGCVMISLGVLADYVGEHRSVLDHLGGPVRHFVSSGLAYEETYEVIGIAFVCLAAIMHFLDPVVRLVKGNVKATLGLLIAGGMITSGNGLLHYQYGPGPKLQFAALLVTLAGFVGLVLANRSASRSDAMLVLLTEEFLYLFVFAVFVVLPTVHGATNSMIALTLWLPAGAFFGWYLYGRHPLQRGGRDGPWQGGPSR